MNIIYKDIDEYVEKSLKIYGHNTKFEIARLILEILRKEKIGFERFKKSISILDFINKDITGKLRFQILKDLLIKRRFPETTKFTKKLNVYLNPLPETIRKEKLNSDITPEKIYIENNSISSPLTRRLLSFFPDTAYEEIDSIKEFKLSNKEKHHDMGKRKIFVTNEKFDFLKPCPCTKNVVRCNYYVYNLGFGCPYDCTYCYLQLYSNFPGIMLISNIDEFLLYSDDLIKKSKARIRRIGTGEFTDSLALDEITNYSSSLIQHFRNRDFYFELKTKSNKVGNILKNKGSKNIVISWSLNPDSIIESDENCTTSLDERLEAAKMCNEAGFSIAFHFDPIIYYENWETDYQNLIEKMKTALGNNIIWISLGTLRFHRKLKPIIEQRFPDSNLIFGELELDKTDGKMRYPDFIRSRIYKKMYKWLNSNNKTIIYLCMEPEDMWDKCNIPVKGSNSIFSL